MSATNRGMRTAEDRAVPALSAEGLTVRFGGDVALADISLDIPRGAVVSVIGPAGSGKTTLLRSFNRMNELIPEAGIEGTVRFGGRDLHAPAMDPAELRRRIGMVFEDATLFPGSVFDNLAFGLRSQGVEDDLHRLAEVALRAVGLWSDGAETLETPSRHLSTEQRRRMCIARTLALEPDVLLVDEPTASLDPTAAARVESLIHALRADYTIVIATCDHMQAGRLSDMTAYLDSRRLIEYGPTQALFTNPRDRRTESYLTGRLP